MNEDFSFVGSGKKGGYGCTAFVSFDRFLLSLYACIAWLHRSLRWVYGCEFIEVHGLPDSSKREGLASSLVGPVCSMPVDTVSGCSSAGMFVVIVVHSGLK